MRSLSPCFHSPCISRSRRMLLPVDTREQESFYRLFILFFLYVGTEQTWALTTSEQAVEAMNFGKLWKYLACMQMLDVRGRARFFIRTKKPDRDKNPCFFFNFFLWHLGSWAERSDLRLWYNRQILWWIRHLRVWLRVKMLRLSLFSHLIERERTEWAWCFWCRRWLQVSLRNVCRGCGMVKSVEKKRSTADQFAVKYKTETSCWTQKLSKEDHGIDKYSYFLLTKLQLKNK